MSGPDDDPADIYATPVPKGDIPPLYYNGNKVRLYTVGESNSLIATIRAAEGVDPSVATADDSARPPKVQGTDRIVIETRKPVSKLQKAALEHEQAIIEEHLGMNRYLAYYKPDNVKNLKDLDFVTAVAPFPTKAKLVGQLADKNLVHGSKPINLLVTLHEVPQDESKIINQVAEAVDVDKNKIKLSENTFELSVSQLQFRDLAHVDAIKSIEVAKEKVVCNDVASKIMGVQPDINGTLYTGKDQIIAIADTGLDTGKIDEIHPAFRGRVKDLIGLPESPWKTYDRVGHGTHVCGSALGAKFEGSISPCPQGTAPGAKLVMQAIGVGDRVKNLSPAQLAALFVDAYKLGARIHSNSWSNDWGTRQQPYNEEAKAIDQCVWDNKQLLICYAAGNDGEKRPTNTVGAMAAAKNCLTVGACDSLRPSQEARLQSNTNRQNDPTEIAYYSSRGPTAERRIKPDVVAPGTTILSARSRRIADGILSSGALTRWGVSPDPDYWIYWSGTSMATPLVAGCAAALREYLASINVKEPSAALVKALLINGAYTYFHAYSGTEGFGRVNLRNSIIAQNTSDAGFVEGGGFDDRDQKKTHEIIIPPPKGPLPDPAPLTVSPPANGGVTLKVTLVYTDYPGQALQNNLNLIVMAEDGSEKHGNTNSSKLLDEYNNVEQIVWKGIPAGKATIFVLASGITFAPQDYALAWRIIPNED